MKPAQRHSVSRRFVQGLLLASGLLVWNDGHVFAAETAGEGASNLVARIRIRTDRVRESVVRRELAFQEGACLRPEALEESRRNLLRLNLFKTLTIHEEWDEALQGLRVDIEAEDGWFALPWPMAGSRGGSRFVSLTLMQFNFFRHAESLVVMGMLQNNEWSGLVAFTQPRYALMAGIFASARTEYVYRDGGYSLKDFSGGNERETPEDFGVIVREYEKALDRAHVHFLLPLDEHWRLSLGGKDVKARYTADSRSDERPASEAIRALTISLLWGQADAPEGGENFVSMFGRIFGLGMAAVLDSKTPLQSVRTSWSARTLLEVAHETWGSDERFVKAGLAVQQHTRFRSRDRLTCYAQVGWGNDLPSSQTLSTGRESGMRGVYAREYRGNRAGVLGAVWTGTLWRDRLGHLSANGFAEAAAVWQGRSRGDKQGVGAGLNYRFWRFPFPLGAGYTYSLDDRNGQISFAMGGMF